MRNTASFFGFIAALGIPLALGGCLTGETEIGHIDASVANCGQGSTPVDLANDSQNCGACGVACASGNVCHQGQCVTQSIVCASGFANCNANAADGCEVDVTTDPLNCGNCGVTCASGTTCMNGKCPPTTGQVACNGVLVDPTSDVHNCGDCGVVCSAANGQALCANGVCGLQSCNKYYADCDANSANGCETKLLTDAMHCSSCSVACGANLACVEGVCSTTGNVCDSGRADCDGNTANGCESDLLTSATNCGACGMTCGSDKTCVAGVCSSGSDICYGTFANCDGLATNGCETNLSSSTNNCGACGKACATGAACVSGTCTNATGPCTANRSNCDNDTSNGCEVDLSTDHANCGACGSACASDKSCIQGQCAYASITCDTGYANCNASLTDGCEVNTATDSLNCGTCANVCQTGTSCVAGVCQPPTGLTLCGAVAVNLLTDPANCGGCGLVCGSSNASASCSAGICSIQCKPSYGNCDGLSANGCETDLNMSATNCGACGNVCAAGKTCTQGSCVTQSLICAVGYGNCDALNTNGCEVNLNTDSNNCGMCGAKCSLAHATSTCSAGSCSIQYCASGYANCDNEPTNGCETDVSSSTTHCGSCATLCTAGKQCTAGACT